jgi:hypothetical protein
MLASCEAWGGTLSALRPHHLSITLIARCIAKYRSPDTCPCGRVHGPHPFIITERPSQLKPNAAMFHDASRECPPRDPPTWSRTVTGVGGVSAQQKISAQAVFGAGVNIDEVGARPAEQLIGSGSSSEEVHGVQSFQAIIGCAADQVIAAGRTDLVIPVPLTQTV